MVATRADAFSGPDRDAMQAALAGAFGAARIDAIARVSGGASGASTFWVEVRGRRYLVRLEGPASPLRNPHQYVAMRLAAQAGIAPPIRYIDEVGRAAVMDFVEGRPLAGFPGGARGLAEALGTLLRRVQATPPFPLFVVYPDIVGRLWAHVCRTGLFVPGVLDAYADRLARIREAYDWRPEDLVSSHNDAIPGNILFDGDRLWLIDWESAYRNDPLVDVATMLDTLAPSPALGDVLLRSWLGRAPDAGLRVRLGLIRGLTRLYYAGVFLSASAAVWRAPPDGDISAPSVAAFRRAVREGRLKPGAAETKHMLGKMYLASFMADTVPPGFDADA